MNKTRYISKIDIGRILTYEIDEYCDNRICFKLNE